MFAIISEQAFKSLEIQKQHSLSKAEAELLVNSKDIINKYFQIKVDWIRAQLGNGDFQWVEASAYWMINALTDMSKDLESMKIQMKAYEEKEKSQKK